MGTAQRDENGRFLKGNTISDGAKKGRPPRKKEEAYQRTMWCAVSQADWKKVVARQLIIALGDKLPIEGTKKVRIPSTTDMNRAALWLSNYLIGKPVERQEMTDKGQEQVQSVLELIYNARTKGGEDAGQEMGD